MMANTSIKVVGLKSLVRQLSALDDDAAKAIQAVNRTAAEQIASEARARAPKRSGKLAASIRAAATKYSASVKAGGSKIPYAAPVHWGWPRRGIAPQTFLYDALDARRGEVVAAYAQGLALAAERVHGGTD
jgi:hypothetical protein